MKIGILTQPLHDNYGGLLQAYALKEVLGQLQHEVIIINRQSRPSKVRALASIIKSLIIGRQIKLNPKLKLTSKQKSIISRNTLLFREKYIPNLTHLITSDKGMLELNKMGFDAYVVGSDQCWRPLYSSKISNYFLDFAENQENIKRIAYAASFGVSDWEFNEVDSRRCSELAKKFDAISVREDSGVDLVKKHLGTNAVHVIDPTMLLPKEHYVQLAKEEGQFESKGNLKVYVLDKTSEKQNFIDSIEGKLGLKQFEVLPNKRLELDKIKDIEDFVFPNPAKWLRGFQDAKFVVTDSFHGTVFSILFRVPFIALGNKSRGMARFESLLKMFELEDRLVTDITSFNVDKMIDREINWDDVHSILEKEKEKALNFLTNIEDQG
ncbi:polysaccharide pyruvyl transferase family protein [Gelidibacter japonicus]|uniref:polysaccharide pyruvyl transferase family protein n=1 Tax=Gelidibacter japonicus TaxID=1962232 RepID=UPI003A8E2CAD